MAPAAHRGPAGTAAHGPQVRCRGPRSPVGVGGHHQGWVSCTLRSRAAMRSRSVAPGSSDLVSSRRTCSSAPVSSSTQASCWQGRKTGSRPEPAAVLLDDLARGARAGEEPGPEVRQLGLQRGAGDEPGVPCPPGTGPSPVARRWRWSRRRRGTRRRTRRARPPQGPPRLAGHEPQHHRQDDELGDAHHAREEQARAPLPWRGRGWMARGGAGCPKTRWSSAEETTGIRSAMAMAKGTSNHHASRANRR